MKSYTKKFYMLFYAFFITMPTLLYSCDEVDKLTAFLRPCLAHKIKQELSTQSKSFPSPLLLQRNSNAPQLGAQEKAGLLKLHMNFLVLDDTEKAIDRVIKKNKLMHIAHKKIATNSFVSKATALSAIYLTMQAINTSAQQVKRSEEPRFIPFDPATIASLAGQAAKPLLIGSLVIGGICYIEHIIRARDLNEIEHLKKDHEKEKVDLTNRMNHLAELIKDAKNSMNKATEDVAEFKEGYNEMKELLIRKIMPKITQLLKQTSTKKTSDITTQQLTEQLNNLTTELQSDSDSVTETLISTNSELKALKQPSLQGAAHKTWKVLFGSQNK